MKRYTHPPRSRTLIASKEGSTVTKEWVFLRPRLSLNADNPNWEQSDMARGALASAVVATGRAAIRALGERLRAPAKGLKMARLLIKKWLHSPNSPHLPRVVRVKGVLNVVQP